MPLAFGLNVKSKTPGNSPAPKQAAPKKSSIFDSDPESDDDNSRSRTVQLGEDITDFGSKDIKSANGGSKAASGRDTKARLQPPPSLKDRNKNGVQDYRDLAAEREAARHAAAAQEVDSTIYDYDSFHATKSSLDAERKAVARQDAIERKPKYMTNLLDAAARRKQDQLVAKEKLLQREREAEGDEFADKEKFVTSAYKKQQEEARAIAEEEERKRVEEEKRRKAGMGGLSGFYKGVMAEQEERHKLAVEAGERAARGEGVKVSEEEGQEGDAQGEVRRAVEEARRQGRDVTVNEEGQVTDKRQLLSAGLNIAPSGGKNDKGGASHLRTDKEKAREAVASRNAGREADKSGQRVRQTRMLEEQLEAGAKRRADEEAEERRVAEHKAKSAKTEGEVSDARARFLARKREREEAKKEGG